MKTKNILPMIIMVTVSFFFLISAAVAQAPDPQKVRLKARLELTPEQKEKMKDVRLDFEREKIKLRADLKIAKLELRSLMAEEELDRGDIYNKIEHMGQLKTKLAKNRVDKRMALREILTKEQLDKLKEFGFRKFGKGRLLEKKMRHRGQYPRRAPLWERFSPRGGMGNFLPELEGSFFETDELAEKAELAQLVDELDLTPLMDLAEPCPLW